MPSRWASRKRSGISSVRGLPTSSSGAHPKTRSVASLAKTTFPFESAETIASTALSASARYWASEVCSAAAVRRRPVSAWSSELANVYTSGTDTPIRPSRNSHVPVSPVKSPSSSPSSRSRPRRIGARTTAGTRRRASAPADRGTREQPDRIALRAASAAGRRRAARSKAPRGWTSCSTCRARRGW